MNLTIIGNEAITFVAYTSFVICILANGDVVRLGIVTGRKDDLPPDPWGPFAASTVRISDNGISL